MIMNQRKKQSLIDQCLSIFDRYPREYFVLAFFLVFFMAIIWETFSYTVLGYKFYNELAYKQQVWEVEVPVTRGTIYNSQNTTQSKNTVFSSSVYLSDLAIDPQIVGDKSKLWEFLTDILYREMCEIQSYSACYDDLLRFLKVLEIDGFEKNQEYITGIIRERITFLISKTKVTSVLLNTQIDVDQEREVLSWNMLWVYPGENWLYVNPEELMDPELFAQKYTEFFGWSYQENLYSVRQRDLRYIPIYRKLSLLLSDEIEQYIADERQAIWQWVLDKDSSIGWFIILTPHAQRIYPERSVWSQIIWFLDNEGKGHYGIEWYFDDALKWNPWELVAKKDIKGRSISPISIWDDSVSALEGIDIYTTIDRNIQRKVEDILEAWVKKYWANKGSVVVMNPKTGKILSMANYPSYNPNDPGKVYELKKVNYAEYPTPETDLLWKTVFVEDIEQWEAFFYDGSKIFLRDATREDYSDYEKTKYIYKNDFWAWVYQNDAISGLYEPWSIMKSITVAVWIDTWEIKASDFYNDEWKLTIDNFTIRNVDNDCLWYNTFQNALNYSCNVGMIRIVQKVWKALLHKYLEDFWFWRPTDISLEWEVFSKLDPYEKWPTSKLLTTSYGLGISTTALQMANAYSTLANGWIHMKPYIIDRITYNDGRVNQFKPEPLKRVIKESTSDTMIDMLVDSVENWVAWNGRVEWYTIAWKTGTSQIAFRWSYETWVASTTWSFAGFAPAEDPLFTVVVKLERPRTSPYWGATSAYMFADIARQILEYYGVPKKESAE